MKFKTWNFKDNFRFYFTLIIIFVLSCIYFITYNSNNNFIKDFEFPMDSSIDLTSKPLNLPAKINDINGIEIKINKKIKRVFIFGNKDCETCLILSPSLPYLIEEFPDLEWFYIEKSNKLPWKVLTGIKSDNFHIIMDNTLKLSRYFLNSHTPEIFFLDDKNRVVWRKLGFIMSDFDKILCALKYLKNKNYDKLKMLSQKRLEKGQLFPDIKCFTFSNKEIRIPSDLKGYNSLIFIIHGTCSYCKRLLKNMPYKLKTDKETKLIIIFTPFSRTLNNKAKKYAKRFGLTQVLYELESQPIEKFYDIDEVIRILGKNKNIIYVNDELLDFQDKISMIAPSTIIYIDKEGKLRGIYSPPVDEKLLKKFYNSLFKFIKRRR